MTFDPSTATPEPTFDPNSAVPEGTPTVRSVAQTVVKLKPDDMAEAERLRKRYPAPVDTLYRNLQDMRVVARADDVESMLRTSPTLAKRFQLDPIVAALAHDDIEPLAKLEESVSRTALGTLNDIGVVAVKGAVGLPQAISGLASLLTGGYAGKALEAVGVRFEDAQKILDSMYSPAQQRSNQAVKEAQGFVDTIGAMLMNPSTIATTVGESAPQMIGGAAAARGIMTMLPKVAPWLAAAMGEGVMGAGSAAEQARTEDADGLLSVKTTFAALLSGAGTALFGAVGGKVAQRLGLADIDTVLVKGGMDAATAGSVKQGFISAIVKAGISEGVFEELPQSIQETMWANWGANRPLGEGVGKAAAQGLLAGLSMGGGFQAVQSAGEKIQQMADQRKAQIDNATYQSEQLADQLKTAGSALLRERSPEQFRALMGEMTDGKIYVDGEVLNQLPPEVIATLPQAVQDQIADAVTSNSTVEIPVADVLTIAPGTPLEQVIVENARSEPGALSQADAKQAAGKAQELLKAEAERVTQQAADQDAFRASSDAVKASIQAELDTTGRFRPAVTEGMATWATAFYTTMAARTGMTPEQFYAKHKLRILGAPSTTAAGPVMDQPKLGELTVEGYHFSNAERPTIVTGAFGTGLAGSSKDEYLNAADKRLAKRAYFYADKGTGINPESGVGGIAQRANLRNVYDGDTDPMRLKTGRDKLGFESAVLDAGFSGYLTRLEGTQSGQVIMLGDQAISAEVLGPMSKTTGKRVPAQGQRASLGRDVIVDALNANTALPMGSPTLARWQELLARTPEVADALREAGVFDGNQAENVFKSDLVKRFIAATEAPVYAQSDAKVNNLTSVAERGARILGTRAVFSPAEKQAVKDSAAKIGVSEKEITATVRGHKLAHPPAQGWAPLTFVRAEIDEGKVTYVYQPVPYSFSSDADGKQIDTESPAYKKRVNAVAKAMADEVRRVFQRAVNGDQNAKNILAQAGWYKAMRARLRQEFGGLGDLFADLLGATSPNTPVRDNWTNAIDTLRRASRGDYDALLPKWVEWADKVDALELDLRGWFNDRMVEGLSKKAIKALPEYQTKITALKAARKLDDSLLPTKESGKKYGFNGRNVARAMVDLWRVVKNADPDIGRGDTAPKALNFSGNLIGFRTRATIDVWAARMLQRLAGGLRVPSMAETGVSGAMREDGTTTLQFGMGQDIFTEAVRRIRADAELKTDPVLAEVNDDDLQAVVWFVEKELWTVNNWTSAAGEGGSFELEASLTGNVQQGRIKELRKVIDSSKSKPDAKAAARAELAKLERSVDRFVGGLSTQMSLDTQGIDFVPTDADMARLADEVRLAAYESDNGTQVLASKMLATEGRYGGVERSLDLEVVARQGYNPSALWAEMLRQAQAAKQDSTFLSRVLRDKEEVDPLRHRPGVEIYFREAAQAAQLETVLADLAKEGVEFLTVIVDGRRMPGAVAGEMPPAVGVRLQYVPEFDQRYGFDNLLALDDVALAAKITEKADEMAKLAERVLATVDGVAFAGQFWHDTQVAFSHQYQEKLDAIAAGNAEGTTGEVGSPQWAGEPVRAGLESADRQARETARGEPDGGTGSTVGGDAVGPPVLEQQAQTPRGTFNPRTLELVLNPNANLSTLFHETGHFFLEVLADIASQPNAPAQIVEDMGTFLKWAGIPDLQTWNAMTLDQKRPYHERWAESVEQYVMEGRAPSVELQPLMRRFATWLKSVYGSIKRFLESRGQVAAGGGETLGQSVDQTETPEFKAWFGDWQDPRAFTSKWPKGKPPVSEVVSGGKPLVVYHATNGDFSQFEIGRPTVNSTTFGDDVTERHAIFATADVKFAEDFLRPGAGKNVMPLYMNIKQVADLREGIPGDVIEDIVKNSDLRRNDFYYIKATDTWSLFDGDFGKQVVTALQAAGYDGALIYENGHTTDASHDVWVAFSPEQVKSATGNDGTFDANDPSLLSQDPAAQPGPQMALNDDIRRVMDRLLATDEQIAQANEVAGLMPNEEADALAAERLNKRSMADLKWAVKARDQVIGKLRKQAAAIEKTIREEVTVEVDQTPEMRAKKALDALSVSPEYAGVLAEHKAARAAAETAVRDEVKAALLAENPDVKGLVKGQLLMKNRRDIDNKVDAAMIKWDTANSTPRRPVNATDADVATIADSFGFESVDAMMQAIDAFGSRKDAIEGLTDRRMLEEHGDLIDERAIMEAANEAVHNEARARSLASELRTQNEMLNPRQDTGQTTAKGSKITVNALVEAAKQFGANVVARTVLRDLKTKAWQHTAAERRAGKAWQEATAKGDTAAAVKAKQDQVLNNAAAKAAIDARAEAAKIFEFFKRVTKGNDETVVEKGRDADMVNAARAVLAAYGVQTAASKGAAEYLDKVAKNDPETYNVIKPMVDAATQNAQPLEALTFEELQALHEEIQAIWFLAKRSRQMEVDGDLMDVEDAAAEIYSRLEEIGIPDTVPGETGALTSREERARRWLQQVPALLRRVEQWAEAKDGKFGGPFLRLLFSPVKDAADRYRTERVVYRKKFQALIDNIAPSMRNELIAAPELGYTFGRGHNGIGTAELLHAVLHTGNESNKRKLLLGRGWATENADGTLDTSRWDAFITRLANEGKLTKAHYDFAQGVWDLLEETKPLAQKTHRDVFGRYFAEVTADAFVDPWGQTRSGGYVPAQADPALVQDADLRELLETENAGMSQSFPATNKGFTKSRVEYNRPLKLDLRSLAQHIDKVLLFSHMEPAVRGAAKLLRQKNVSQPLARVDPAAMGGMLKPWLNRAARQTVETPIAGDAGLNRLASTVRGRVGMALMFANVSNTLQQITGFSTAALRVKPALMMRAAAQFIRHPKQLRESVWALSPYMADRASNEVAVLSDTMEKILLDPSVYERAEMFTRQHGYFLQSAFDNAMSPIIWSAAYNQAVAEGMDDRMAIRFADGTIRQTQGSTLAEDVSRIETGPAYARLFTQFIGYFNMLTNTNATAIKQIAAEQGLRKGAGKAFGVLMLGLMVPIWVAETIAVGMRGGPDDEDDDGYLDDWLAAVFGFGTIKGILAQVPFIGQASQSVVNRFNSQPADDKFSLSPTVSVLEAAAGAPASVYKAIVEDGNAQKAVRDVSALITVTTGLPAMAVARPVGYAAGVAQDKIEPTGPVDAARGMVTGTASPDSKQR